MRRTFPKPSTGLIIDVGESSNAKEQSARQREVKQLALNHNAVTTLGVPPPGSTTPEGYEAPEYVEAKHKAKMQEVGALDVIKGIDDKRSSPAHKQRRSKNRILTEQSLERGDWEAVVAMFQHSGKPEVIATQTGLDQKQVKHLLEYGLRRLGLPSVQEYTVDQAKLQLDTAKMQREQAMSVYSQDVANAVQNRAVQEAAAARDMLTQTINAGTIVSGYVQAFMERLADGRTQLLIPDEVDVGAIEAMSKVVDAHSRAMERAIKMVRLTQGEPTEMVEHQVGALLAMCTTKELEEAERTGTLPKRLTSRISGADPVKAKTTIVDSPSSSPSPSNGNGKLQPPLETAPQLAPQPEPEPEPEQRQEPELKAATALDMAQEAAQKSLPSWMQDIDPAEGESSSTVETQGEDQ